MIARDRHDTAFADVESDCGDVGGGIVVPLAIERRRRIERLRAQQIVERHHAVGQVFSEAADVADGEYVGGDGHGELAMIERADTAAGDQCFGADARQRRDGIGAAPQKRQRRDDHSRAQYAEYGENVLDDVGQLDADDGVGRQSHAAQPPGDRRDRTVGLGVGQPSRLAVGEAFAVDRVNEGERVGMAPRMAAEYRLDGHGVRAARRRRIAEDHCSAFG